MIRLKDTFIIVFYTSLFFAISLTLGFFSSYILSKKNYNFRFPLFVTSIQNLIHFVLASLYLSIRSRWKSQAEKKKKIVNSNILESRYSCLHVDKISINESNLNKEEDVVQYHDSSKQNAKKNIEQRIDRKSGDKISQKIDQMDLNDQESKNIDRQTKFNDYFAKNERLSTTEQDDREDDDQRLTVNCSQKIEKLEETVEEKGKSIIDIKSHNDILINEEEKASLYEMIYSKKDLTTPMSEKESIENYNDCKEINSPNERIRNFTDDSLVINSLKSNKNIEDICFHENKHNENDDKIKIPSDCKMEEDEKRKQSAKNHIKEKKIVLSFKQNLVALLKKLSEIDYLLTTLPCATSAAVDIGLSSYSLRTVSLAFYTMIKSSTPVFVLCSGFLFGIEQPSIILFLTIFTITSGVFITTITTDSATKSLKFCMSKTMFSLLFASFMAGFRWAFVQFLIERGRNTRKSVIYTIKDLCLPISVILLMLSAYNEGLINIYNSEYFRSLVAIQRNVGFILISGILSFFLLVSEFLLVSHTSVIYLSISSILKELVIVVISVIRKEINFEYINYGGLIISIVGVVFYNYLRLTQSKKPNDTQIKE